MKYFKSILITCCLISTTGIAESFDDVQSTIRGITNGVNAMAYFALLNTPQPAGARSAGRYSTSRMTDEELHKLRYEVLVVHNKWAGGPLTLKNVHAAIGGDYPVIKVILAYANDDRLEGDKLALAIIKKGVDLTNCCSIDNYRTAVAEYCRYSHADHETKANMIAEAMLLPMIDAHINSSFRYLMQMHVIYGEYMTDYTEDYLFTTVQTEFAPELSSGEEASWWAYYIKRRAL